MGLEDQEGVRIDAHRLEYNFWMQVVNLFGAW